MSSSYRVEHDGLRLGGGDAACLEVPHHLAIFQLYGIMFDIWYETSNFTLSYASFRLLVSEKSFLVALKQVPFRIHNINESVIFFFNFHSATSPNIYRKRIPSNFATQFSNYSDELHCRRLVISVFLIDRSPAINKPLF
jgi:hypothetical protein